MIIQYNRRLGTCRVIREGFSDVILDINDPNLDSQITSLAAEITPVPDKVRLWAAKAALEEVGLLDEVEALVVSLSPAHRWAWREALDIYRSSVIPLAALLSQPLTEAQVNQLFIRALEIENSTL
jgi:hypothetical protein